MRDSPEFAKALRAIKPLLVAADATPRAIKRYQNRMRYLSTRLYPAVYEPDLVDSLLHWLGGRLGRPLVPGLWFNESPQSAISEPALILLGAIELIEPKAFANAAEFFSILEHAAPDDPRSNERAGAWLKVRDAFINENLTMPTVFDAERYAAFMQNTKRRPNHQAAEVVRLVREATPDPHSD